MSPSTATATRQRTSPRPASRRSRTAARRRRRSLAAMLVALAIVAVAVVMAMPLARRAEDYLSLPLHYQSTIRHQAAVEHLDPALVAAVIYTETKFDPRNSSAGAVGLMQMLPQTAEFLARRSGATTFSPADLNDPRINITYGTYYLRYLVDEFHGSRMLAIAAYNGGDANVDRWVAAAHARGQSLTIAAIPFPETRAYVQRVLQARRQYRATYASQLGYG